jgi:hypothetical protein
MLYSLFVSLSFLLTVYNFCTTSGGGLSIPSPASSLSFHNLSCHCFSFSHHYLLLFSVPIVYFIVSIVFVWLHFPSRRFAFRFADLMNQCLINDFDLRIGFSVRCWWSYVPTVLPDSFNKLFSYGLKLGSSGERRPGWGIRPRSGTGSLRYA